VQQQNVIISIGDRAQVRSSGLCGIVKFVGDVHYARGEFVGIALDEPLGKNDGTVKGKSYFTCSPKHGIFVRRNDILIVSSCSS